MYKMKYLYLRILLDLGEFKLGRNKLDRSELKKKLEFVLQSKNCYRE